MRLGRKATVPSDETHRSTGLGELHPLLARYYEATKARLGSRSRHDRGVVESRWIARYAAAIGSTNPIHSDREAAQAAGYADVVAPPNFLAGIFDWTDGLPEHELNPDGTPPDGGRDVQFSSLRGMGAGESMNIRKPLIAGTLVIEEEELVDVVLKQGLRGYSVFVTQEHTFSTADGEVLNMNRRTVVIRAPHEGDDL